MAVSRKTGITGPDRTRRCMDEQFLHYIWKFQKFDATELSTTDGKQVIVFNTGIHNTDSGPDFEAAKIKIGGIIWAGHVEVHVRSSDWGRHKHSTDPAYDNVILHIVWIDDVPRSFSIPTLEISKRIDPGLSARYQSFITVQAAYSVRQPDT